MSNPQPQAAIQSDAAAVYRTAVLVASGIDRPMDLAASLGLLQEAANAGHAPAQAELAALAGNWKLATDLRSGKKSRQSSWAQFRAAIDTAAWLRVPQGQMLSTAPRIAIVRGFLAAAACDWLIALGRPLLKKATIYDKRSGALREDVDRSNSAAAFDLQSSDMVLAFLRARIAALAELPTRALESSQVLHYRVGEEFVQHHDFLDVSHPGLAQEVAKHGQRVLTLLIYLNNDYDGGETAFPLLGKRFRGKKGDALVFWNVDEKGVPNHLTLHAGTAPTRGEKWLFSQWIRIRLRAA